LSVYPINHKGGYASNGNATDNDQITESTKLGWSEKDYVTVGASATTLTVTLPAKADLGSITGTVTCDETNASADCSGWIDAWNGTDGKGVLVSSNGAFTIKGLTAATYELNYWANSGLVLNKSNVVVTANAVTTANVTKDLANMLKAITGTVTGTLTDVYVVLIKTDGITPEVINTTTIDSSGNFSFGAMPKAKSGKALVVAAAKRTVNADNSTSVKFDNAIEVSDVAGTVNGTGINAANINDFVTDLSAVANGY
jgi:hypothetical protein